MGSDQQPRDERGRWTSGGGASPSNQDAIDHTMKALAGVHRAVAVRHADQPSVGTEHNMSDAERSQKIAAWRDRGTSDAQVREGIRAMFNLPSKERT